VRIDRVAPTLAPKVPSVLLLGTSATVKPHAADTGGSRLASSACGVLRTASIGRRTVTCTATDRAGNTTRVSRSYTVLARVSSFVHPSRARSLAVRGTTVTVRFTLAGAHGRLSRSASARLARAKVVRVVLTGPRVAADAPLTALCTWSKRTSTFACRLALPKKLAAGHRNPYRLTVQLKTGRSTWTAAAGKSNHLRLYLV
jgi:hypothetical protein